MHRNSLFITLFCLTGWASAGFCFTEPGEDPLPVTKYAGTPKQVRWQAFQDLGDGKSRPVWQMTDTLKNGQVEKRVTYANNTKISESFTYQGKIMTSGTTRTTELGLEQMFGGQSEDDPTKQLDALELKAPKTANKPVKATYSQNRLSTYSGFTTLQDKYWPVQVKCSYPNKNAIVEEQNINVNALSLKIKLTYTLDNKNRLQQKTVTQSMSAGGAAKTTTTTLVYAPDNRSATFKTTLSDGASSTTGKYTFDTQGRILSATESHDDASITTTWKYDQTGNWTEKNTNQDNGTAFLIRRTIKY